MQPTEPENPGFIPGPESNHQPQPRPGRIRQQDESTTARPESVAEARARARAQKQRAADELQAARDAADAAAKRRRRRTQMISAGVGVGVVGAIALLYVSVPDSPQQVTQTATCVDENGSVVPDANCSTGTINPVTGFILLNGLGYRYNYGGTVNNGRINGGTFDRPTNTAFTTPTGSPVDPARATSFGTNGQTNSGSKPAAPAVSGSNKNIDRGGLGTSNKSSSSGSRSSGS